MRTRKIKVEVTLDDGSKITLTLNSAVSKAKIQKFLDMIELMEERLSFTENSSVNDLLEKSSVMEKVTYLVYSRFIGQTFSLKDLIREFESVYGFRLKKNVASTYLSRLVDQGILNRMGSRGSYKYVIIPPSRRVSFRDDLLGARHS